MTVGGGPMDSGALGRAERTLGTKFLRVFGMSECLGHTTPLPTEDEDVRLGRDGRPFPGTTCASSTTDGVPRRARRGRPAAGARARRSSSGMPATARPSRRR